MKMNKISGATIAAATLMLTGCSSSRQCVDARGVVVPNPSWCTAPPAPAVSAGYVPPFIYRTYNRGYTRSGFSGFTQGGFGGGGSSVS